MLHCFVLFLSMMLTSKGLFLVPSSNFRFLKRDLCVIKSACKGFSCCSVKFIEKVTALLANFEFSCTNIFLLLELTMSVSTGLILSVIIFNMEGTGNPRTSANSRILQCRINSYAKRNGTSAVLALLGSDFREKKIIARGTNHDRMRRRAWATRAGADALAGAGTCATGPKALSDSPARG